MKELFLNSFTTTIYKTLSAGIKVMLIILITNMFGAENYGAYTFSISIFLFLNTIFRFGFDVYLHQNVAEIYTGNNRIQAQTILLKTVSISILFLFFISLFAKLILDFDWLEGLKFTFLNYLILYSSFYSGMWLFAYYFRGLNKGKTSVVILEIIFPILNILLIFIFKLFINEPAQILIHSYGISVIISLIIFLGIEKMNYKFLFLERKNIFNQSIFIEIKSAIPFLLISVSSMLLAWVDFYVISFFESDFELGIYSVSTRLAIFMLFPTSAIAIFFSNKLVLFYKNNDFKSIKEYLKNITVVLMSISVLLFIILNIFSSQILNIFGEEFKEGRIVLLILTFGYMINATFGAFETVILMSLHKKLLFKLNLIVVFTNLIINIPLVYLYGINGAAFGTLISILVNRFLQYKVINDKILVQNK